MGEAAFQSTSPHNCEDKCVLLSIYVNLRSLLRVEFTPSKKRNITPPDLDLDIETIDIKINDELGNIREMVETFLNNPEPPVWIPPESATASNKEFLKNLQILSYSNGSPSLLFHNLDVYDNKEVEKIFGHGVHQYVSINCASNTSQRVQPGSFATHLDRAKHVACWKASPNTGDSTSLRLRMSTELVSTIYGMPWTISPSIHGSPTLKKLM